MDADLPIVIGALVGVWFVGLATGFTFRAVKNIFERASRP